MTLIQLLFVIAIICLIVWLLQRLPIPAPFSWIVPCVVILLLIFFLLNMLGVDVGLHSRVV